MTVTNMSVEGGAKAGMIAPDEKTFEYLEGCPHAPEGPPSTPRWSTGRRSSPTPDAQFDKEVVLDASSMTPFVSWGTNPAQVVALDGSVPAPDEYADPDLRAAAERALDYMAPADPASR